MATSIKLSDQIKQALQSAGLMYGLRFLHNTSPYRFTALYLVREYALRNLPFFDRENPSAATRPAELPITAAYCIFPYSTETQCEIADAASDSRTTDHPMRERIASYIGSPLIDEKGNVFGTLCHFDVEPVVPTEEVRATLRDVAGFLGRNMPSLC
jgi:GAF domain-containing protein